MAPIFKIVSRFSVWLGIYFQAFIQINQSFFAIAVLFNVTSSVVFSESKYLKLLLTCSALFPLNSCRSLFLRFLMHTSPDMASTSYTVVAYFFFLLLWVKCHLYESASEQKFLSCWAWLLIKVTNVIKKNNRDDDVWP